MLIFRISLVLVDDGFIVGGEEFLWCSRFLFVSCYSWDFLWGFWGVMNSLEYVYVSEKDFFNDFFVCFISLSFIVSLFFFLKG